MTRHPERAAAAVNGLLVLLVLGGFGSGDLDATYAFWSLALAILAGWRTRTHAARYREGLSLGWSGVFEAGATALGVFLFAFADLIVRRLAALPIFVLYGSIALAVGLVFGLVLRASALLTLRFGGVADA